MMKKRWLSVAAVLVFSLMLMSCGKASSEAGQDKDTGAPAEAVTSVDESLTEEEDTAEEAGTDVTDVETAAEEEAE